MAPAILHLSLPVRDLAEAKAFYTDALGCDLGRERVDWIDVWFFGMQLTLQSRPNEVRDDSDPGVRHFGVALSDQRSFDDVVNRLLQHEVRWLSPPAAHDGARLSGKTNVKLADPSGNVIEIKYYEDPTDYLATELPRE